MKVLICGGRHYDDQENFAKVMDQISQGLQRQICVIQGGATGADWLARSWATDRMIPVCTFPAQWARFGKAAGPIRNQWMLEYGQPELVIAFPGGKGTLNMIKIAEAEGIEVRRIDW